MRAALLLGFLISCKGQGEGPRVSDDIECDGKGPSETLLVRSMSFARAVDGVSDGFDLDNHVTEGVDPVGCNVRDWLGPEGQAGIDNAMAALLPILDTTEAVVLEDLMQASINDGSMLLMIGLSDLDDPTDDACVDASVFKAIGDAMVGADGWLLPNQTLDLDTESPITEVSDGWIADGVFEIGPIDMVTLNVTVLDLDAIAEIHDVRIRLEAQPDGSWSGVLGGGLSVEQLMYVATLANVDDVIAELMGPALAVMADLAPDESGSCTQLSVSMPIVAVPAFLFDDDA